MQEIKLLFFNQSETLTNSKQYCLNKNNADFELNTITNDEYNNDNKDLSMEICGNSFIKTFDDSSKVLDYDNYFFLNNNGSIINRIEKEYIQKNIRDNIYIKKPFKEKKKLGRKIKLEENLGEHNKFSDDNIQRKLKNAILTNIFDSSTKK